MKTILLLLAIFSTSVYFNLKGFDDLCTGDIGTRAFLTGDYGTIGQVCRFYDYSKYFPEQFEAKTNAYRIFQ